jgi:hypothetical protein
MAIDAGLALISIEAARLGERALANEAWLVGGFLADATFTPQGYLDAAERHRALQRVLFTFTELLLAHTPPPLVA